ncbi:MAG: shikimate kinase [Deltaproteobacteria bacterium]|nr:shikimate kinase [Deltaproteobacteria bacterium]
MKHIILIGYRCTGKTSVGRKVAEKLGLPFYDTDQVIVSRIGKTIKAWVEEKGWASFRQEEKAVINKIASLEPGVISLGGGAVMDPEIREMLRSMGLIVWLTADIETILTRMKSDPNNTDSRPPLSDKDWETEINDLLTQRSPVYRQLANFSIETEGKTVEAVVEELVSLIGKY